MILAEISSMNLSGAGSMIFKIIGSICILTACSGLGFNMAKQWTKHLETLETLRKMILLLKSEILYSNAPLAEALEIVGTKSPGILGDFFIGVSDRIKRQDGELFYTMWKQEINGIEADSYLSDTDRNQLESFGEHLGFLDLAQQERTILLYLEQLDLAINYLREHQREKRRLYTSLGVMGGLFLMIIMF